ncbi:MAG: L-threonylcarbamoyladenylate synthase [Phycisphaerales bacterium]
MSDVEHSATEQLQAAVHVLRAGGLVAFPTETVYGLGADALREDAVRCVFELKQRPPENPLIVHVSGPEMARRLASNWTSDAAALASAFWPGPLSIVVPKRPEVPGIVTGGSGSIGVAVRCPDHPVALALLYAFGAPLVGPSANRSGRISPTTAQHVRESFAGEELFILDGGPCATGIESTVVSLLGAPRVLRAGVVSAEQLSRVLGKDVLPAALPGAEEGGRARPAGTPLPSPGMLTRHYAPSKPARLLPADQIRGVLAQAAGVDPAYAVLSHTITSVPPGSTLIAMPPGDSEYAAALYTALRRAENSGGAEILIEAPPMSSPTWHAIRDRLIRACAPGR